MSNTNFKDMTLGQLKEVAKHMRVAVDKSATAEEIIEAISKRQRGRTVADIAQKGSSLQPGYARIRIDETQTSNKQIPVYVFDNGLEYTIPRGVEVDVPIRIMNHLRNAKVKRRKQVDGEDGRPKTTFLEVLQYPFQVIDLAPGPEIKTKREEAAERLIGPRRRYRDMFGRWPRPRDMTRAIESGILKLNTNEELPQSEIMLEDTK